MKFSREDRGDHWYVQVSGNWIEVVLLVAAVIAIIVGIAWRF
jgi:hypothetical protein